MCSTSACDLEEIPLDDDDSNSMEFKILAFYVKHHVFKSTPAVFTPKMQRTRSLFQRWSVSESWAQMSWPCRTSRSSEKPLNIGKIKSSWRTLFGVVEKEEDTQGLPVQYQVQGPEIPASPRSPRSQQWSRSLSNVEQHVEQEAVDPKVVSIANRVAEIVHSWPPPEDIHYQRGKFKSKPSVVPQGPQAQCSKPRSENAQKDGEDQIIAKIVELLKYSGDQLERELKKDKAWMNSFQEGLSYSVFKTITDQFLRGVDTRGESEVTAHGFKAALAIDVAAKLTAIDNHPINRVLGFGTKYLKENFSSWVQQHGGWEKILMISHEEVD